MGKRFILYCLLFASCSPVSHKALTKTFVETELRFQDHTGFMLFDPSTGKELYSYNASKYFIPASNTKIVTFYSGLLLLGDSIPSLQYAELGDSLIIKGTGDPSFLYPHSYNNTKTFDFLKSSKRTLYLNTSNFFTTPLGRGWAWSDYNYSYSSERSSFPVFGNVFLAQQNKSARLSVTPGTFKKHFWLADSIHHSSFVMRELGSNRTDFFPGKEVEERTWEVPFRAEVNVVTDVLADTLKRNVFALRTNQPKLEYKTLYSVPADSLYKTMMQESDNFIAEQLLLLCAGVLSDSLKPEIAIQYMKKNALADLPDELVWVDGSGLSRYNLFTPRSIVALWSKIDNLVPRDRLFSLLAVGGKAGTIKNLYKNDPPFIYGKTGTLSNNHCLSGYLVAKSGRTLIFSFMSNNYVTSASEIRTRMDSILRTIYENY
jgi:serine-type D-Ala-D-Ala carboxypeptidase/endopeptidase (penicillin-binding protein 4)